MRVIHLYADRPANQFVQGFSAANPLVELAVGQRDKLQFVVHNAVRNTAVPAAVPYVEKPLSFDSMWASIGYIDAAPNRGTFKLKVDDQTTATELTWPTDLSTPALITSWKASVLAALKGLSNVADDDIVAADAADTKAHFFYFRWTDPEREDVIEVVENSLLPLTQVEQSGSMTDFGYTQLLKFTQFPVAYTSNFTRPSPPAVTITETQPGGTGVNAEQTVIIPSDSTGSVAFVWDGAQTKSMAVQTMTASSLAAALNAVVADGDTNPSFAVEDRPARAGRRLAVQFVGPLAGAAQAELDVVMIDQESVPYAVGTIDLAAFPLGVEQALNGERFADLIFELSIVSAGRETFIRDIRILNDMTGEETEENADAAGAIAIREVEVVVDNSTLDPFASVAPGASFTPPSAVSAGGGQSVTHNLGSLNTRVWVQYKSSLVPEEWRELQRGGEFDWKNTSANVSVVNIVYPLTNASESDTYDRRRFKIFVASPDAVLEIFGTIETTWAKVRESLPSGQTLTAKLAAIDAALGVLGGSLTINASQIVGLLTASQIDISSISTAFASNSSFLTTLRALITDSTLVENISSSFTSSAAFLTTLKTLITNSEVINALSSSLVTNTVFASSLRTLIIEIIQGTAGALTDAVVMRFPDHAETFPAPFSETVLGLLPRAVFSPTDLGAIEGGVPRARSSNAGKYYTVGTAGASLAPMRRKRFKSGDVIYSTGFDWYAAEVDGTKRCAKEMARELFTLEVNEQMLALGTRLGFVYSFSLQCLGNVEAYYRFRLVRGTPDATGSANTDFSGITVVETLCDLKLVVTDVATMHTIGYAVTRPLTGAMVATKQIYTKKDIAATAPTDANIILRAQLDRFDTEDVAEPRGQILLSTPTGQLATIVAL